MHRRTAIVNQIVAALEADPSMPPVIVGRVHPELPASLPILNVVLGTEDVIDDREVSGAGYPRQRRSLEITIEIHAGAESNLDAAADAIALQIEAALGPLGLGPTAGRVGGTATTLRYQGSDPPDRDGATDGPLIARELTYGVIYDVDVTDPQ